MNERFSLTDVITGFHHDFRSVLNNLVGYVNHLLDGRGGSITPSQEESLQIILKNAHRLMLMVDNLSHAVCESGIQFSSTEVFDLREIAERSLQLYSLSAHDAGIHLESTWEGTRFPIQGSELLIGSLIDNLLSNAIKYTSSGGKVTVHGKNTGEAIVVQVGDTGMGIPPDDLPHIFDRGFRGIVTGGGRREGLGLGLSICRRIAEAHGARIEVSSQMGEGTKIEVIFPVPSSDFTQSR